MSNEYKDWLRDDEYGNKPKNASYWKRRCKKAEAKLNKSIPVFDAVKFIAGQKEKSGNWAVEIAKRSLCEYKEE